MVTSLLEANLDNNQFKSATKLLESGSELTYYECSLIDIIVVFRWLVTLIKVFKILARNGKGLLSNSRRHKIIII